MVILDNFLEIIPFFKFLKRLSKIKSFESRYFAISREDEKKKKIEENGGMNFVMFWNDSYLASSFIYYGISRTTNAISIIAWICKMYVQTARLQAGLEGREGITII